MGIRKWQTVVRVLEVIFLIVFLPSPGPAADAGYQIGPGDVLRISVYDHPDLTTVARVDDQGRVTFPLVGQIEIGGQPAAAAAQLIATKLKGDYVVNPQVAVFIEEFRSKKVVIIGEVVRPGLYELSGPTTLLELISKAGGLTRGAGRSATVHRPQRETADQETTFTVSLAELFGSGRGAGNLALIDGDTVNVAKAGVVYVTGQVSRPAAYSLDSDMTVIKAITLAGGFTPLAAQGRIKIIRKIEGTEQVIDNVTLHDKLLPEDVMVIPESFF